MEKEILHFCFFVPPWDTPLPYTLPTDYTLLGPSDFLFPCLPQLCRSTPTLDAHHHLLMFACFLHVHLLTLILLHTPDCIGAPGLYLPLVRFSFEARVKDKTHTHLSLSYQSEFGAHSEKLHISYYLERPSRSSWTWQMPLQRVKCM